jgi:hypothetical protein
VVMEEVTSTIVMKDGGDKDPSVAASCRHQALRVVRDARCPRKGRVPRFNARSVSRTWGHGTMGHDAG